MPPSIAIVTSAHPTDDTRVFHKFAKSFLDAGWQVSWAGVDLKTAGSQRPAEITWRLAPPPRSRAQRLLSVPRLLRTARELPAPVDWLYCPDPDAMVAAIPIARRLRARLIFDIHEMFHETHMTKWVGRRENRAASAAVRVGIRALAARADIVASPAPALLEAYVDATRPQILLRNTVPRRFADAVTAARAAEPPEGPLFMAGKPGRSRGIPEIAKALEYVAAEHGSTARALVLGEAQELRTTLEADEPGLWDRTSRFFVVSRPVPHDTMPKTLAPCTAGIIGYTGPMAGPNLGNRTFEYMAAGIPVLAPVESPRIAEILDSQGCGLKYSNADYRTLGEAMTQVITDDEGTRRMGAAGREAFLSTYSWDAEFERLLDLMSALDRGALSAGPG